MSREHVQVNYGKRWMMFCDREGCTTVEGAAENVNDLPLARFRDMGWFIAQLYGDLCPACLDAGHQPASAPMPESWFEYPPLTIHQLTYSAGDSALVLRKD